MAYTLIYTADLTNELGMDVEVHIEQKDAAPPAEVINLEVTELKIVDMADAQEVDACIIAKELTLSVNVSDDVPVTWETFITSSHDEWKIKVWVDTKIFFVGFLTPDEGYAPFQDKPYDVTIKASDGIGLLKGSELKKTDGTDYVGFFTLIDYIQACLFRTGLELPIRIYCNIFNGAMLNKGDSLDYDLFQEVELNARTFLKDAGVYESCYDALKIMLDGWCNINQYEGRWQIVVLSERQRTPGSWYYVDYDWQGTVLGGAIDTENEAQVGKDELIYPIYETQIISSKKALKSVRKSFSYVMPPEYVNNQRLQKLGAFISPLSGSGFSAWNVVGWTFEKNWLSRTAATGTPYIKTEFDAYDKETDRYYFVPNDTTGTPPDSCAFISNDNDDFFVDAGDKLGGSITWKHMYPVSVSAVQICGFNILVDGGNPTVSTDWWSYNAVTGAFENGYLYTGWAYDDGSTGQWQTASFEQVVIPVSGTLYVMLKASSGPGAGAGTMFKDLQINYTPYVRGSRFYAKGDYSLRSQTAVFPDVEDKPVLISDAPKRIIKGAFFWTNGSGTRVLLDTNFYRWPDTGGSTSFKQLATLGRFNHTYRRFYKIEGDFTSLFYNTIADELIRRPLSFHKKYRFTDMTPNRDFLLIPSLESDLMSGNITAVFQEVVKDSNDGTQEGDEDIFGYIF